MGKRLCSKQSLFRLYGGLSDCWDGFGALWEKTRTDTVSFSFCCICCGSGVISSIILVYCFSCYRRVGSRDGVKFVADVHCRNITGRNSWKDGFYQSTDDCYWYLIDLLY